MRGKGTAGLGILLAAGLIIWAVARPAPDTEEAGPSNDTPMGTTARRAAGGAVVAIGTTVAPPPAPAAVPELDPEVLKEIFAQALREAGLDLEPGQIQGLVAQYQAIAARANALLSSAAANPSLLSAGAPQSLDPTQILNFLASQLGASLIPKGVAPSAPVAKKPAHAVQPAAPRPAPLPGSGAAVEGGKGGMMRMEPDLDMNMDMDMDMNMDMD